jgi:hypothetical protein
MSIQYTVTCYLLLLLLLILIFLLLKLLLLVLLLLVIILRGSLVAALVPDTDEMRFSEATTVTIADVCSSEAG